MKYLVGVSGQHFILYASVSLIDTLHQVILHKPRYNDHYDIHKPRYNNHYNIHKPRFNNHYNIHKIRLIIIMFYMNLVIIPNILHEFILNKSTSVY